MLILNTRVMMGRLYTLLKVFIIYMVAKLSILNILAIKCLNIKISLLTALKVFGLFIAPVIFWLFVYLGLLSLVKARSIVCKISCQAMKTKLNFVKSAKVICNKHVFIPKVLS